MPAYTTQPLERRLVESAAVFVATDALLAALEIRGRDDDRIITPQDEEAKTTRLILVAQDLGRSQRTGHPIRTLQLRLTLRANTKAPDLTEDIFDEQCAALERLLDESNLKASLDSAALGVRVMLVTRVPGCQSSKAGFIHTQRYTLDVKAVPAERAA